MILIKKRGRTKLKVINLLLTVFNFSFFLNTVSNKLKRNCKHFAHGFQRFNTANNSLLLTVPIGVSCVHNCRTIIRNEQIFIEDKYNIHGTVEILRNKCIKYVWIYRMDSFIRYLSGICRTYAILKISRIKIHFQNSLIVKRISILFYKNVSLDRRESIKLVCT